MSPDYRVHRWIGGEHRDGCSAWVCGDCGHFVDDEDEGCEHCGYGREDEEEYEYEDEEEYDDE